MNFHLQSLIEYKGQSSKRLLFTLKVIFVGSPLMSGICCLKKLHQFDTLNLKAPNLRMNSKVKKTVKMMLRASRT